MNVEKFIEISDEKYDIFAAYHSENRWVGSDKTVLYALDKKTQERHLMLVSLEDGTREILSEIKLPKIPELTYYTVWEEKVFYTDGEKLGILDLNTRKTEIIFSLDFTDEERAAMFSGEKKNFDNLLSMPHVTNDGKFVSIFRIYINPASAEPNGYIPDKYTEMMVFDVEKKELIYQFNKSFRGCFWFANHVAINPENPDLLAFSHEGDSNIMSNRVWFYDNKLKKAWNAIKQEMTEDMEVAENITHELWSYDGKKMYYVRPQDCLAERGLAWFDIETKEKMVKYSKYRYNHVCPSRDERFLLADDVIPQGDRMVAEIVLVDRTDDSETLVDVVEETGFHPSHAHPQMAPDNSKFSYTYLNEKGNLAVKIAYL